MTGEGPSGGGGPRRAAGSGTAYAAAEVPAVGEGPFLRIANHYAAELLRA